MKDISFIGFFSFFLIYFERFIEMRALDETTN